MVDLNANLTLSEGLGSGLAINSRNPLCSHPNSQSAWPRGTCLGSGTLFCRPLAAVARDLQAVVLPVSEIEERAAIGYSRQDPGDDKLS